MNRFFKFLDFKNFVCLVLSQLLMFVYVWFARKYNINGLDLFFMPLSLTISSSLFNTWLINSFDNLKK